MYNRINDKLVGLLIRARRRDLLTFEGEMLYQRRDDETWIVLTKSLNTIHALYGRDTDVAGGGSVDPLVQATLVFDLATSGSELSKRGSMSSVASLPTNICSHVAGCAEMLGNTALAVAGISSLQEISPQPAGSSPATPAEKPANTTSVGGKSGGKSGGIRESFRKLVKPLVKRRTDVGADHEDGSADEESDRDQSRRNSRRGSRMSVSLAAMTTQDNSPRRINPDQMIRQQMHDRLQSHRGSSDAAVIVEEEGATGSSSTWQLPIESKWRKILGVSLAISR